MRAGARGELAHYADIEVVGEAANGDEAVQQTAAWQPDVLLLDIEMPGLKATEVIRYARALPRPACVLILTAHDDIDDVHDMLEAGATGYLLKNAAPDVIADAIRAVAEGKSWLSDEVAQKLARQVIEEKQQPTYKKLTDRELEVLRLAAASRTNTEIGTALSISERTVRFHLRSIYDKLGVNTRTEAAVWAIKCGLDEASRS
jgi:DNA-binding NarL/FixJ family response regulator